MKKLIVFICLGNICRSPMAEFICKDLLIKNNLISSYDVISAGTGGYHNGEDMHSGTKQILKNNKIYIDSFFSKQLDKNILEKATYLITMDDNNFFDTKYLLKKFNIKKNVIKICDYSSNYSFVPDPYYDHNFKLVYDILTNAINNFINTELIKKEDH